MRTLPQLIDSGTSYDQVTVTGNSTLAITSNGILKGWGNNYYGQLGDAISLGTGTRRLSPSVIDTEETYLNLSYSGSTSCVINANHYLKCWGSNDQGQLGDGTHNDRTFIPAGASTGGSCEVIDSGNTAIVSNPVCYCDHHTCSINLTGLSEGNTNISYRITDGSGTYTANGALSILVTPNLGCTNTVALNFDSEAQLDNGSCTFIEGCMDSGATNFDPTATHDNGSCSYVMGCTDWIALNYNEFAVRDDGSCTYNYGCTDGAASNFNPSATRDDGSCTY